MKGTFNQGWWNCFETFAALLLDQNGNNDGLLREVLTGAGITRWEARAWLDKPVARNPKVEHVVRQYWLTTKN